MPFDQMILWVSSNEMHKQIEIYNAKAHYSVKMHKIPIIVYSYLRPLSHDVYLFFELLTSKHLGKESSFLMVESWSLVEWCLLASLARTLLCLLFFCRRSHRRVCRLFSGRLRRLLDLLCAHHRLLFF